MKRAGIILSLLFVASSISFNYAFADETCDGHVVTINGNDLPDDKPIKGTNGDDVILGTSGNDKIDGRDGNDIICGGDGDDDIRGGKGDDRIFGEDGDDKLRGEQDNDFLVGGNGEDKIWGGNGVDSCDAMSDDEKVFSCEILIGDDDDVQDQIDNLQNQIDNLQQQINDIINGIISIVVPWSSLTGVPDGLDDGDDDTLNELTCGEGQVAKFVLGQWECSDDTGGDVSGFAVLEGDNNFIGENTFSGDIVLETGLTCTDSSGCVSGNTILEDTIDSSRIGPNSVTDEELDTNAVTTDKIAPQSITGVKIDPDAIVLGSVIKFGSIVSIPPEDAVEDTLSCDNSDQIITGFNVLVTGESPVVIESLTLSVDSKSIDFVISNPALGTIEIPVLDDANAQIGLGVITNVPVDMTPIIFCTTVSPSP